MEERNTPATSLIQTPAQVVSLSPKQDRSWKLVFETRELTGDDVKVLADNFQGEGWLVFKPNSVSIRPEEVPTEDAQANTKTPSQRLRAVIMVLWKQKGGKGDPESFYRTTLETLIEYMKSKLEPES